eukprot:gene31033-7125_t
MSNCERFSLPLVVSQHVQQAVFSVIHPIRVDLATLDICDATRASGCPARSYPKSARARPFSLSLSTASPASSTGVPSPKGCLFQSPTLPPSPWDTPSPTGPPSPHGQNTRSITCQPSPSDVPSHTSAPSPPGSNTRSITCQPSPSDVPSHTSAPSPPGSNTRSNTWQSFPSEVPSHRSGHSEPCNLDIPSPTRIIPLPGFVPWKDTAYICLHPSEEGSGGGGSGGGGGGSRVTNGSGDSDPLDSLHAPTSPTRPHPKHRLSARGLHSLEPGTIAAGSGAKSGGLGAGLGLPVPHGDMPHPLATHGDMAPAFALTGVMVREGEGALAIVVPSAQPRRLPQTPPDLPTFGAPSAFELGLPRPRPDDEKDLNLVEA